MKVLCVVLLACVALVDARPNAQFGNGFNNGGFNNGGFNNGGFNNGGFNNGKHT